MTVSNLQLSLNTPLLAERKKRWLNDGSNCDRVALADLIKLVVKVMLYQEPLLYLPLSPAMFTQEDNISGPHKRRESGWF